MSASRACSVKPLNISMPSSTVIFTAKCSASVMMSVVRSRNGGRVITSKARRSSRSARNFPCSASSGRSSLVAPMMRTSVRTVSLPPTRSNSPYSITRRTFSCTPDDVLDSSSRNRLPLWASSNLPSLRLPAPVNDPASCPNSSVSSRDSASAAQFILMKGLSHRLERKWIRAAISSLPVPRSPITRTGRFSGATLETCSSTSRNAGDSPINC